ncbi:Rrf2 family transcriptional regulator [Psychrobacter sp. SCQQ22]|uniref:Rrf2 family transcriptional regulator n=1 Tax=Psychrobacter TaxID=497 RepID=UPI0018CE5BA8|nr:MULTISPECIES: Rrf2 family transcriptional regulator [Psychrobacter]MBH0086266.1 Rrf2 family transcriptional regulator [Psychrobacter sp. SCQQ22]
MRLTNYSDYALRSLIYLAVKPEPHTLANISDISNSYDISKSHLTKVIHQLGQLGYIESVRGKNGGIRLARAPKEINLGILIKQIEPDFDLVECFAVPVSKGEGSQSKDLPVTFIEEKTDKPIGCVITPVCQLKSVFSEALRAFITVLERYTLADIINNEDELKDLLFR